MRTSKFIFFDYDSQHACCGFDSYKDWLKKKGYISNSCCKKKRNETCTEEIASKVRGCKKYIQEYMNEITKHLPLIFMLIFILQVLKLKKIYF